MNAIPALPMLPVKCLMGDRITCAGSCSKLDAMERVSAAAIANTLSSSSGLRLCVPVSIITVHAKHTALSTPMMFRFAIRGGSATVDDLETMFLPLF
jgi:hypothetical protein